MERVAPATATRWPALERLLTRAAVRPLGASPWARLATLAGGEALDWPVAPVSALGDGCSDPGTWLRIEPLGADAEGRGGFRLRAAGLGISGTEARALALAFNEIFAGEGLRLEVATPERWYLVADRAVSGRHGWRGFDLPAGPLSPGERPAPPEPGLRRLLSEAELLFHAHPVNEARRARGSAAITTLHPWGGGEMLPCAGLPGMTEVRRGGSPQVGCPAAEEPYLAGLRRLGVLPALAITAPHATSHALAPQGGVAWPVPIESMDSSVLEQIETDWAEPLLARLRRGRLPALRVITASTEFTLGRGDAWRAWRRPRPLAELL